MYIYIYIYIYTRTTFSNMDLVKSSKEAGGPPDGRPGNVPAARWKVCVYLCVSCLCLCVCVRTSCIFVGYRQN